MSSPLVGLQPLRQPAPNANHDMTWLYIVETEAEERPSDAVVAEVHAGDIERERRPPPSYTLIRPRGAIIRCTLCLTKNNKWITWSNDVIMMLLREHLYDEHFFPSRRGRAKDTSSQRQALKSRRTASGPWGGLSIFTSWDNTRSRAEHLNPNQGPASQFVSRPLRSNLPHTVPPVMKPPSRPSTVDLGPTIPDSRLEPKVAQMPDEADVEFDSHTRTNTSSIIKKLRAELRQVEEERDREVDARRALEEEVGRLRAAASAREEEWLTGSRLISASLEASLAALSKGKGSA